MKLTPTRISSLGGSHDRTTNTQTCLVGQSLFRPRTALLLVFLAFMFLWVAGVHDTVTIVPWQGEGKSGKVLGGISKEQLELIEAAKHLRPAYDRDYGGYAGPWIEDRFFELFLASPHSPDEPLYLPVFWTNLQITGTPEDRARWKTKAKAFVETYVRPDRKYFAVIQFKKGVAQLDLVLPPNIHIFSAGGALSGDFPNKNPVSTIPLIKGELIPHEPPLPKIEENFIVTTINKTSPVRNKMTKALDLRRDFKYKRYLGEEFADVMEQAVYVLCPRGSGRTSWRLVETLQLNAIPIHIWDEEEAVPYDQVPNFMWEMVGLSIHINQIRLLPELIKSQPARAVTQRLANIRRLRKWFTLDGSIEYILRTIRGEEVLF